MASIVEPVQATEDVTAESKPSPVVVPSSAPVEGGNVKEAETSTPEPAQESEEAVWSTIATSSPTLQATEKEIPDSTKAVVDSPSTSVSEEVKKAESKEAVPGGQDAPTTSASGNLKKVEAKETAPSGQNALTTAASSEVKSNETKETKDVAPSGQDASSVTASGEAKKVEAKEAIPAVPSGRDAPSTAAPAIAPTTKTEEVKVEEVSVSKVVSKIVSGVAEDIDNVQDGLAKEVASATGEEVSDPSLLQTIEGGLKVVEKEIVKGAVETVAAVEAHPELIAEGVLAAAVGAASMVQPELLPGAIAIVGKMASDAAKKTVVKIATDEGKKIGAAIGKDISDDAAKEKAAKKAKEGPDGAKEKVPAKEGETDVKTAPLEASKDAPKIGEASNGLTSGHENTEKPTEKNVAKPETSTAQATADTPKSKEYEPTSTESTPPEKVEAPSKVEVKSESEPKPIPTPVKADEAPIPTPEQPPASQHESKPVVLAAASITKTTTTTKITTDEPASIAPNNIEKVAKPITATETAKDTPIPAPEQPSTSQQESKPLVLAAAASITKTTTTTKTPNGEPAASPEKPMANISQESLDQLHQKIDSLHLAIKQITETLALHLPPPTPALESSKKDNAEAIPEPEVVSVPSEPPAVLAPQPSHAIATETTIDPVTSSTEDTRPKRPTLEKRSSVLGSIGKILWPFGSSSPTKSVVDGVEISTADSNTPKVPTVTVTEVPPTPEIEI